MTATPLEDILRRRIRADGPLTIAEWMALCLCHPVHGYYMRRDPLGSAGDFTTAPEISQMFGEMIGAWVAQCWLDAGAPARLILAEAGPGRGTLMADALRATAHVPGFHDALELHLVETSPALRAEQAERLAAFDPAWHDNIDNLPEGPLILVANEFLDALPLRQFRRMPDGWAEVMVGIDDAGKLTFLTGQPDPAIPALIPVHLRDQPPGSVVEICPAATATAGRLAARIAAGGIAALLIDYGHDGQCSGDTLQAVRGHRFAPLLDAPGEADLTAHVDFGQLAAGIEGAGAQAHGPVEQGRWLAELGIGLRATTLRRNATPAQLAEIDAALERLANPRQMGSLFKVMAITQKGAAPPPGF